jgi:hypothetical protein
MQSPILRTIMYAITLVSLASSTGCGGETNPVVLLVGEDGTWDTRGVDDLVVDPGPDGSPDLLIDSGDDAAPPTDLDAAPEVDPGDLTDVTDVSDVADLTDLLDLTDLPDLTDAGHDEETGADADSLTDAETFADLEIEADGADTWDTEDAVPEVEDIPVVEPDIPPATVRVLAWAGGGIQLALEIPPESGGPDEWPDAWLDSQVDGPIEVVLSGANLTTGLTAILVVPTDNGVESAQRVAMAHAVLDALPEGEQVALLVARDEPVLLAELSSDRSHAHAQLALLAPEPGWTAGPVMNEMRMMMADLESRYSSLGRSVVVIGETVMETPPHILRPVQTLSLADITDPVADAEALVSQLLARRGAIVRLGACAGFADDQPFDLHWGNAVVSLEAPSPMEHLAAEVCDPVAAAQDDYPYPTEVMLTFTPAEFMVYEQYYAQKSKEEFTTSVTLGVGLPIPAMAHFHGQGTMNCVRKSITVELDGPRRRLLPDFASDRFILISMCQDDRYFGQVFGNHLLAALGLFPSRFKHVRLRVNGVNKGVYMLVHQAERAFRDRSLGLLNVMRRLYDIDGQLADVKYLSYPDMFDEALAYFESIGELGLNGPPETLEADLDARLDLDAYLRLLGANSLLMNGDFIDETFFASSVEDGVERYRAMGWDNDDLLSACHAGGVRAIDDACGVTYCTEGKVDHALLRSPAVYQRYLDALDFVMEALTPELMQATMDDVQADLFALLSDDETAAACTEMVIQNPQAATAAGAQADITIHMENFLAGIEARRQALNDALAVCPEAMP